jgi:KaiC/GvpD/RAD55 family RecA-like ATPase
MSHNVDTFAHAQLKNRITFDYPLDLLLNRECRLTDYEGNILRSIRQYNIRAYKAIAESGTAPEIKADELAKGDIGCIMLPPDDVDKPNDSHSPLGTGNILIKGRPGTGKSTLALQMAVACTWRPNHYSSIFFSLEESCGNVWKKAQNLGWDQKIRQVFYLDDIDDASSPERIGRALKDLLTQPGCCEMLQEKDKNSKHTHSDCIEPCVLLPMLSPRSISPDERGPDSLFWERYKQLEKLLIGAKWLRKEGENKAKGIPDIRLACIDSLNVFGDQLLTRTELFKLFDLFTRYGVIGVFTAEQHLEGGESSSTDAANYLADIVINLQMEEDNGYAVRYFEIEKSRYQHEVYGKHPLRMRGQEIFTRHRLKWWNTDKIAENVASKFAKSKLSETVSVAGESVQNEFSTDIIKSKLRKLEILQGGAEEGYSNEPEKYMIDNYATELEEYYWYLRSQKIDFAARKDEIKNQVQNILDNRVGMHQSVMVQPSVHYIVSATEPEKDDKNQSKGVVSDEDFDSGEPNLNLIIKPGLKKGSAVTLKGPRGTYKTIIARNFLLNWVVNKSKNVLLINFGERGTFPSAKARVEKDIKTLWKTYREINPDWKKFELIRANRIDDSKRCLEVYEYKAEENNIPNPFFIELSLKGGALLPEELLEFVRDILRRYRNRGNPIRTVVIDDCSLIGVSYPFLRKSKTAGDMFLPAFVHVMRNYGIDLMMTGTTGQLAESNEMVDRACQLADSVVTCDYCDVFGDRYVTVSGEGLTAASMYSSEKLTRYFEYAPAVIMADEKENNKYFYINTELLKGLVGFETGKVHRPVLTIHLFTQQGSIYTNYKKEVEGLMLYAVESSMKSEVTTKKEDTDISIKPFEVTSSDAYHSSLEVLEGKPIDRTVIYTLDEFWKSPDWNIQGSLVDLSDFFVNKNKNKDNKNKNDPHKRYIGDYSIWPCSSPNENDSTYAVPFYANVLVVAFDKNIKGILKEGLTWKNLAEVTKENRFFCDQATKETLSCILIDCLIAAHSDKLQKVMTEREGKIHEPIALYENDQLIGKEVLKILKDKDSVVADNFITNLYHAGRLFSTIKSIRNDQVFKENLKNDILDKDARIQICWYSQIRQLINNHPALSDRIRICALPGGGFRGDWYLAIAKGSVCMDLGINAIRILTTKHEEYNRFAKGVGLPVRNEFMHRRKGFLAWPHSHAVKAVKLFDIHRKAFSRASITGYTYFRRMLSTMVEEVNVAVKEGLNRKQSEEKIKTEITNIVKRIPAQITLLEDTGKKKTPEK